MADGPLDGLRVVDLTDDSGRFATKLLAECGASVARLGQGTSGPSMRSADLARRGGVLDWWYDGGKQRISVDLDRDEGRATIAVSPRWPTSSSRPRRPAGSPTSESTTATWSARILGWCKSH